MSWCDEMSTRSNDSVEKKMMKIEVLVVIKTIVVHFLMTQIVAENDIYGYSLGAAMGRFKHPRKGIKMDRTTERHIAFYNTGGKDAP